MCNLSRLGIHKWNAKDHSCFELSFGIGGNYRLEEELAARAGNRRVTEIFDPCARKWKASNNPQLCVHELGLSPVETEG